MNPPFVLNFIFAMTLLIQTAAAAVDAKHSRTVIPGFQTQLADLYTEGRCDEIVKRTDAEIVEYLRPNVMAIVASCDPPWKSAEEIFSEAEKKMPTGDLILVLHAKYRTKKNPDSAEELWRKVLLIARNNAFISMANQYFAGEYDELDRPISLNPVTILGSVSVGGGLESNPRERELVYLPSHGSGAGYLNGEVTWRHWYRWGSLAVNGDVAVSDYFTQQQFSDQQLNLRIPIAFSVSSSKDIVLQPFGGDERAGGFPYRTFYGLSVMGVVYKSDYRQSVQGTAYQEYFYPDTISNVDGAHYRFDYNWEFFRDLRTWGMQYTVEHVSGGSEPSFNGVTGTFPFTHTDLSTTLKYESNLRYFTFGFSPLFLYRIDNEASEYPLKDTGEVIRRRRHDFEIAAKTYAIIPLSADVQVIATLARDQVFSNIGSNDYVDRNQSNDVFSLLLKASLSSY